VSSVDLSNLRSVNDDQMPFESREPENFTTAVLNHSTVLEFAKLCKGAKIINNDATNEVTYRLHSNRGTARFVPVNSEVEIIEWFSDIFIIPDGVTGTGQLEMDLVKFEDARRRI